MVSSRTNSLISKYATPRTQATTSTITFTRTTLAIAKDSLRWSSKMTEVSPLPLQPALWTQISKIKLKTSLTKVLASTVCKFSPPNSSGLEISRYTELRQSSICKINSKLSYLLNWVTWLLKKATHLLNCTKICIKWSALMEILNNMSLNKMATSNSTKDMELITSITLLIKETSHELISRFSMIPLNSQILTKICFKTRLPTIIRS